MLGKKSKKSISFASPIKWNNVNNSKKILKIIYIKFKKYKKMKNSYLITGGTGSFGSAFVEKLLKSKIKIQRLVIFSRDELKQSVMEEKYPKKKYPFIRFFFRRYKRP